MVSLIHYELLSALIFSIGMLGVLLKRNLIAVFMCSELMLAGVNIHLVALGRFTNNVETHVMVIMIMAVAASEVAIGLSLFVNIFRKLKVATSDAIRGLKG